MKRESELVRGVHLTRMGVKYLASSLLESVYSALSNVVYNYLPDWSKRNEDARLAALKPN